MQRHKECCEGEKTSLPAPTGSVDSRRPHSRKQMKGSRVFIAGASEGSAGKAVRGQAGLAHRHGAACCNKHILRGLVQSSHSVCLPQNTDSKPYQPQGTFSFTTDISVHETEHHPIKLNVCLCFGCSRCSQSSFQTSLCLLVNQVWFCHSSAKCS